MNYDGGTPQPLPRVHTLIDEMMIDYPWSCLIHGIVTWMPKDRDALPWIYIYVASASTARDVSTHKWQWINGSDIQESRAHCHTVFNFNVHNQS